MTPELQQRIDSLTRQFQADGFVVEQLPDQPEDVLVLRDRDGERHLIDVVLVTE